MNDDLISIIIPIYNVEKYLNQCLDSVIRQTYSNIEIILIDDGSPDKCGKICDEYAEIDDRIRVIHQKNGGLSKARNVGIEKANGEYISFIDSDDFVSENFIEFLYRAIKETGALIASTEYDINKFTDGQEDTIKFTRNFTECRIRKAEIKDALELMLYQIIPNGAQYRLYKKEIFRELRFPEGWVFEDVATVHKAFINSNWIAIIKASIYAYRVRPDGIVKSKFSDAKMVVIPITQKLYKEISEYDESLKCAAASRVFAQNYHVFLQIPYKDKENMKLVWKEMLKYRDIVIHDQSEYIRKKNKVGALSSMLGMNVAYLLGKVYLKLR